MSSKSPKLEIGDFHAFKDWLVVHGPSPGTCGTYYAAMRTYMRESGEILNRDTLRTSQDVKRIRQVVESSIAKRTTSISPLRLVRALVPGLNHYVSFASAHVRVVPKEHSRPLRAACDYSFADILDYVRHHSGGPINTIGGQTTFTVELSDRTGGIRVHPAGSKQPYSFPGNDGFFAKFNAVRSFTTTHYTDITRFSVYLLALLRDVIVERAGGVLPTNLPVEEIEVLAAPATERKALLTSRIGQGQYRDDLLRLRTNCYVTGLSHKDFLRASHIKPWAKCINSERLDPHNGLLLAPHYDHLFDKGYISFAEDGSLLVSPSLPPNVARTFALPLKYRGADLGERTRTYLSYHRAQVFRSKT